MLSPALALGLLLQPPPIGGPLPWQPGALIPITAEVPREDWQEAGRFDLDGDGREDVVMECLRGRGPLSTYWSVLRLRALDKVRFLRNGEPLNADAEVTVKDLLSATHVMRLCTVGGSLRVEGKAGDISNGPWWGQPRAALGLVVLDPESPRLGYVIIGVGPGGSLSTFERHLVPLVPARVKVRLQQ